MAVDLTTFLLKDIEELEMKNRILSLKLEECQTELQQYKAYCIELESKFCNDLKIGGKENGI